MGIKEFNADRDLAEKAKQESADTDGVSPETATALERQGLVVPGSDPLEWTAKGNQVRAARVAAESERR